MRTTYTIQELRALGVETIDQSVLIGVGAHRREIRAVEGVVTLDLSAIVSEIGGPTALTLGATLAARDQPEETPNTPAPAKLKSPKKNAALELS